MVGDAFRQETEKLTTYDRARYLSLALGLVAVRSTLKPFVISKNTRIDDQHKNDLEGNGWNCLGVSHNELYAGLYYTCFPFNDSNGMVEQFHLDSRLGQGIVGIVSTDAARSFASVILFRYSV